MDRATLKRRVCEEVDAMATESFGGMRVVRAFSRQKSETNRIMRGIDLPPGQYLFASSSAIRAEPGAILR